MAIGYIFIALLVGQIACSGTDHGATGAASVADPTSAAPAVAEVSGVAPRGALVMLEPSGGAPMPGGAAVMDQFSKLFVPDVLFVRVGQPVVFKNSEDQLHNVTVLRRPTGRQVFNISQSLGDSYTHIFEAVGEYDVNCDVHAGMQATIVATTTPHAAYADASGKFVLRDISPGQFMVRAFGQGREWQQTIEVAVPSVNIGDVTRMGQ